MKWDYKNSGYENKSDCILSKIKDRIGGEIRISKKGVPHLVIPKVYGMVDGVVQERLYSVCYFASLRCLKVWVDYATPQNRCLGMFKEYPSVINYMTKVLNECGW